ncbi:hypothetical protein AX17_004243 [Amanita inopinata Kibby_2008]|nr:hypothetical protein AX17_004243 [Amanita inopinata Kibby_2008]
MNTIVIHPVRRCPRGQIDDFIDVLLAPVWSSGIKPVPWWVEEAAQKEGSAAVEGREEVEEGLGKEEVEEETSIVLEYIDVAEQVEWKQGALEEEKEWEARTSATVAGEFDEYDDAKVDVYGGTCDGTEEDMVCKSVWSDSEDSFDYSDKRSPAFLGSIDAIAPIGESFHKLFSIITAVSRTAIKRRKHWKRVPGQSRSSKAL